MEIKIKDMLISEIPWELNEEYGTFTICNKDKALKIRDGLQKIINYIDKKINEKENEKNKSI